MKQWRALLAFLSLGVLLAVFSWAFFQPNFFRVHDFTHVARLVELRRALDAGAFPVHWTQNFGFGYGMPLFLFYGPLPSYFAAAINWAGLTPVWAVKLTFAFTGLLAASGMLVFLRRWGYTAAVTGAALLLAAPYRAVDLFVRGALNEVFAIGILPWLLHSLWQIGEKPRTGLLWSAFWTALLILTHNLTALMTLPVLYLLAALHIGWEKVDRVRRLAFLAGAGLLGVLLSAFYALPAFLEKDQTVIGDILSGYFDYHQHFLYIRQFFWPRWGYGGSEFGPNDGISFHLGWPLWAALGLSGALIVWRWWQARRITFTKKDLTITSLVAGGAASLFLTLGHSLFLWESLPLLPFIQFPWRFLGLAIILLSAAAGLGLSQIRPARLRYLAGLLLVAAIVAGQTKFHQPEKFLTNDDDYYYADEVRIRSQMSDILPDYIPRGFDQDLPPVEPTQRIAIQPEPQKSSWELNRPHELLLLTAVPSEATITWNIADFPGWHYYVNDREIEPAKLPDGRRQLQTPGPVEAVGARFSLTPLRAVSLAASVLGWIFFASLVTERRKHA